MFSIHSLRSIALAGLVTFAGVGTAMAQPHDMKTKRAAPSAPVVRVVARYAPAPSPVQTVRVRETVHVTPARPVAVANARANEAWSRREASEAQARRQAAERSRMEAQQQRREANERARREEAARQAAEQARKAAAERARRQAAESRMHAEHGRSHDARQHADRDGYGQVRVRFGR